MTAPGLETATPADPPVRSGTGQANETAGAGLDTALEVFLAERTQLFRIAHRVTGDVASAEDVVQEAWLRWQRTDRGLIKNPAAFLTTTTTHLAINVIQSARHRHEAPTESPLARLADPSNDPALEAERKAVLEKILELLMARLSSGKLAAYVLRRGFDYPYGEIARLLRTSSANARQLVRRAQQRIEGDHERPVDATDHRRLVTAFEAATRTGDLASLEALLMRAAQPSTRTHDRAPMRLTHRPAPGVP
ncbi:sigma-70 family RNA polymerase sigma factor [Jiangella anatolica]|uniref:RNA polymerase subunit sigma-70 n=1 Tax=Jiangella anatolica TaxID=2670374 RepID=A0A2W2BLM4_9ACTN|nr:sigma-70 family RNA polymerase sigma factor [Jiangella anatolica]PZF86250.1 RNA polymerase subunit sigma-70 [Jiangella anatolica]